MQETLKMKELWKFLEITSSNFTNGQKIGIIMLINLDKCVTIHIHMGNENLKKLYEPKEQN